MKQKLVILTAFATPLRSGAEACAEEVASALSSEYECTIITAKMRKSLPRHDTYKGVPVIRVGLGCRFDHWLYPFLAPIASRKIHPNIIHGVLETFAGLALYFCKFSCPRAKRVLTMQTTNRKFLKKFIIKSPDVLTAISTPLVEFAKKNGRGDVIHISNGIPLNLIPNIEKVSGRIVFVGRIEKMKGIDTLINAISIVSKSLPDRGISCHIVGGGSQSKSLEELSESLELSDIVKFVGFKKLPDVYTEFAEAEIFCGLSRSEALGNVFLEAQAAGCAVIGTHVGGIPDIIDDLETGMLVEPDDTEAASNALIKLLSDNELSNRLSKSGKEHADKFDWSVIADTYNNVYKNLI